VEWGGSFARYLHVVVDLEGVVEVEEVLHLVVGDAAVDHRLLARVNDDERKLKWMERIRDSLAPRAGGSWQNNRLSDTYEGLQY
jgi:hypothetical protein